MLWGARKCTLGKEEVHLGEIGSALDTHTVADHTLRRYGKSLQFLSILYK